MVQAPEQKSFTEAAGRPGCAGVKRQQQEATLCVERRGLRMKLVELYGKLRYAVQMEGITMLAAA